MKRLRGILTETATQSGTRRAQKSTLLGVCLTEHRDHTRYVNDNGIAEGCSVVLAHEEGHAGSLHGIARGRGRVGSP